MCVQTSSILNENWDDYPTFLPYMVIGLCDQTFRLSVKFLIKFVLKVRHEEYDFDIWV